MKKQLLAALCISASLVSGCRSDALSHTKAPTPTFPVSESVVDDSDRAAVPDFVRKVQNGYQHAIHKSGLSHFSLGKIVESDNGKFYKFCINCGAAWNDPDVTFQVSDSGEPLGHFDVDLPAKVDNQTLKQIIALSICAVSDTDFSDSGDLVDQLVNSFDGSHPGDYVGIGNYFFALKPAYNAQLNPSLVVVDKSAINPPVDVSQYEEYSEEAMSSPLNVGEPCVISGTVDSSAWLNSNQALTVSSGEKKYIVYFNPDNFAASFEPGMPYAFYGTVAASRDGYSGCLLLQHYEAY